MLKFTNARKEACIENWPLGGNRRGVARFYTEAREGKGERVCRVTTGKPVLGNYYSKTAIVDGEDGKTYILGYTSQYGFIYIMQGDMKYSAGSVFPADPSFAELMELIDSAK